MSARAVHLAFDGSVIGEVTETPVAALPQVLERAQAGARVMRELTREERARILRKAHDQFLAEREDLARTVALEGSKPIREARAEVDRASQTLLFSAEEARRLAGEEIPMDAAPGGKGRMAMTIRQPLGVIAAITPFNFPLNLSMHKVGPAIAAGNSIIHKPASATPLSALKAAKILADCGLPEGALQVIVGPGGELGRALVSADPVKLVTFTGSAAVGIGLRRDAGLKRVTLELGNNSAVVVTADADLELAASSCVAGAYGHSGQTCISVQRIYVARAVRDAFVQRFDAARSRLQMDHPLEDRCEIASLIDEKEAVRVENWIGEAVSAGARRIGGGHRHGTVLEPALLTDVPASTHLAVDEAFGPVAYVNAFDTLEEAIALVNNSRYGLQAGIFTRDLATAWRFAREVECGGVLINDVSNFRVDQMPYGGVKESGTGKEGPHYAIEEMTELKLVSWRL